MAFPTAMLAVLMGVFILISSSWAFRCPGTQWMARRGTQTCYYVYQDVQHPATPSAQRKTFADAIQECRALGGTLAVFDDEHEMVSTTPPTLINLIIISLGL